MRRKKRYLALRPERRQSFGFIFHSTSRKRREDGRTPGEASVFPQIQFGLLSGRSGGVATVQSPCRCSNVRLVCNCEADKAALPPVLLLPSPRPPESTTSCCGLKGTEPYFYLRRITKGRTSTWRGTRAISPGLMAKK